MTLSINALVAITIVPVVVYFGVMVALMIGHPFSVPVGLLASGGAVVGIVSIALANFLWFRRPRLAVDSAPFN